jgi:hypothetical protein
MIEPTFDDIGRAVVYRRGDERGVINGFNREYVFVRYGVDFGAKATMREDLEWESMRKPGQFRDITALEVLKDGQTEAMENLGGAALAMAQVAGTIDARFAAIEARLKTLEEAHEAVPGRAGERGVVSTEAGQADIEQLPQDRDASGSAVEAGDQVPLSASGRTATARDDG